MELEFLIATNGFKGTWSAIEYGAWLAESMKTRVTLLGVTEELNPAAIDDHHPLEDIFERAVGLFKDKGVDYSLEIQNGEAEQVIPNKANQKDYITVVGPLGRAPLKRWLTGRSIRPLMEKIASPILYVPVTRLPMKKMLVSIGGLGYAVTAENLAFRVATATRAEVTILHVVPPSDLDYPSTRNVREHINDLADTDTLPGRSLRQALDVARSTGLSAKVVTREGNVVDEILAEVQDGNYDMVCMGSSFSAHTLRQLYTPNVTAEIAESMNCPVLTARYQPESG